VAGIELHFVAIDKGATGNHDTGQEQGGGFLVHFRSLSYVRPPGLRETAMVIFFEDAVSNGGKVKAPTRIISERTRDAAVTAYGGQRHALLRLRFGKRQSPSEHDGSVYPRRVSVA
jgi:hypothetical protein